MHFQITWIVLSDDAMAIFRCVDTVVSYLWEFEAIIGDFLRKSIHETETEENCNKISKESAAKNGF